MAGVLIALVGVAVLAVAFVALRQHDRNAASGTPPRTITSTATVPPSTVHSTPSPGPDSPDSPESPESPSPDDSAATTSTGPAWHAYIGSKPLKVLNVVGDTGDDTLGQQAAETFERGGWTVTSVDEDYENNIASTVAYYDPDVPGAHRAARVLRRQFPVITRVEPRFAPVPGGEPLPSGPVVVVLTGDYHP